MRAYVAHYTDGRTRRLWAMSHEQAARQAAFYGDVEAVMAAVSG